MNNTVTRESLRNVLGRTHDLILQNGKLIKARKESFNLFSILNVERREEHTHSAFIAELLDKDGSHLLGNTFLKLFLSTLETSIEVDFDVDNYLVVVEKYIGYNNYEESTGGRIDIYLEDKTTGSSISIENKIDAGDQPKQLKRYHNYNLGKNTVLYLTLDGKEASEDSCEDLELGKDYHCIGYNSHIKDWLERCLKEASDHPILRESLKQYLLLIKQLTNTLEMEEQKALENLVLNNLEEANFIRSSFDQVLKDHRHSIRTKVIHRLAVQLPAYELEEGAPTDHAISPIWLAPKGTPEHAFYFGIESFGTGGHLDGKLFIGIHDYGGTNAHIQLEENNLLQQHHWKSYQTILHENEPILFQDIDFIKKTVNEIFVERLVTTIVDASLKYILQYEQKLIELNG